MSAWGSTCEDRQVSSRVRFTPDFGRTARTLNACASALAAGHEIAMQMSIRFSRVCTSANRDSRADGRFWFPVSLGDSRPIAFSGRAPAKVQAHLGRERPSRAGCGSTGTEDPKAADVALARQGEGRCEVSSRDGMGAQFCAGVAHKVGWTSHRETDRDPRKGLAEMLGQRSEGGVNSVRYLVAWW